MSEVFVVFSISTTCDEQGVYVTKDSAEIIEIAWQSLDSTTLEELSKDSVLIRPVNTPITTLCTSLTGLTWEHVRNAGTFKDAINKIDKFIHETITSKGLEFTFITLNAWDLRVQLPREARDKSVVLPPYLQHSRVFDLKQEYTKWQAHHPEALSYSASNLSSVITALEVEVDQNRVPFQLNSAQQPPRRSYDEVELLSSILKALARKSQPVEDHPDVLTRPFDARADVRAFLAERSKVLHLSNLPNDTTQSELESWFTQYGGRPIAFWTLKTPDQHKPTGSGFAVFSSHEEAAESLAMNGRALNDKSVEVQPSSARVLDRAQEILTPFPPSKNRPRPGDWTCPSCGFSNFQRRTACFRCSFPAASAAAIQELRYAPNQQGQQSHQNHQHNNTAGSSNNNNHSHNNSNNNVLHNNGSNNNINSGSTNNNNNNGHNNNNNNSHNNNNHNNNHNNNSNNSNNGNENNNRGNSNGRNTSVPFRAGDWKCGNEGCSYHNFAKNICCLRCGAPRVTVVNDQFQQPSQQPQQGQQPQNQQQVQQQQLPQQQLPQQLSQQHQQQIHHHQQHQQQQQLPVQLNQPQQQQYFQQIYNETSDLNDLSSKINGIAINNNYIPINTDGN